MFRRNSLATTAAGLLAVVALVAGCSSAPLTDVRKILSNAKTNTDSLTSMHFRIEADGQFMFGYPAATPTPTLAPAPTLAPTPTPTATPVASPSAAASAAASSSGLAVASGSPKLSAAPSPSVSPSPIASATPSATLNPTPLPTSGPSPSPTPTPVYTTMPISLQGTQAEGDIDLLNKTAHVTGGVPGLPTLSGELIEISPFAYFRSYGATKYAMSDDTGMGVLNPALSSAPSPAWIVREIVTLANDPSLSPVLLGTEQEAGGPAYHIRVEVTKQVAQAALKSIGQALGSGELNLWITQDGLQLERLEFKTADPTSGTAAIRVVLSNWNNVQAIKAPDPQNFDVPALPSTGQ